eukprot:11194436-Lingulodinium_polyedra.AAC.1
MLQGPLGPGGRQWISNTSTGDTKWLPEGLWSLSFNDIGMGFIYNTKQPDERVWVTELLDQALFKEPVLHFLLHS